MTTSDDFQPGSSKSTKSPFTEEQILSEAYWTLIGDAEIDSIDFPETFVLDETRLEKLRLLCSHLVIICSTIVTTINFGGSTFASANIFKTDLKDKLKILFDTQETETNLTERLSTIAEMVCLDCEQYVIKTSSNMLGSDPARWELLKKQIIGLADSKNPVRKLMSNRVKSFVLSWIGKKPTNPVQIPPGLNIVEKELAGLTGVFLKLVAHNREVFGEHYKRILTSLLESKVEA